MDDNIINVLLVENDTSERKFVSRTLAGCSNSITFCTESCERLDEAAELLKTKSFDIVLLDTKLPNRSEAGAIKALRQLNPNIPVVVITEQTDEQSAIDAIKNGADDYLVKGKISKDVLGRSIRYSIERKKEYQRNEQQKNELLEEVESANKELKDFAYIISHDLKAPLRGIKALVSWLSTDYADKFDDEGAEQLNMLTARVDRMHNLIEGVLQYSRVGRIREQIVPVDLAQLVPSIIDMLSPPENIGIKIEDTLPVIECEKTHISQVFQNLLSNAVKYMDKPAGLIKINCCQDNGLWKFSITDNGPGIEKEHFDRIFQMFQTLAPRDKVESTGVGLTIVKKIVELYDGQIWVESTPGEGSSFFFTLPKQEKGVKNAQFQTNYAC